MSTTQSYHSADFFLWGTATSSHQIEGGNIHNDWWAFEQAGKIENGDRSGIATDHWNRFREDIRLAAELNTNSYRFSIEWSRIQPRPGEWNTVALDRYLEIILECEKYKILPMVALHHFTSPKWFADLGGFSNSEAAALFLAYVKKVHAHLGSRIPIWLTFNEPVVLIVGTYFGKFMPPAEFSPAKASAAFYQILKAHALTYDWIKANSSVREGPFSDHTLQVGFAHNMIHFVPDRAWHPMDMVLARFFDRFYNRSWLDGVLGKTPRFAIPAVLPQPRPVIEAMNRVTTDFIGVNFYTKGYCRFRPPNPGPEQSKELPIGISFARDGETQSDVNWAIDPAGFSKILKSVSKLGLPIIITENGIADDRDFLRPAYIQSHLHVMKDLIAEGLDIRGYYHWSLTDNFEWIKGFKPRFGLYKVDYKTLKRIKTASAQLYGDFILSQTTKHQPYSF